LGAGGETQKAPVKRCETRICPAHQASLVTEETQGTMVQPCGTATRCTLEEPNDDRKMKDERLTHDMLFSITGKDCP
jgi:hypothetical protein